MLALLLANLQYHLRRKDARTLLKDFLGIVCEIFCKSFLWSVFKHVGSYYVQLEKLVYKF